MKIRILLIAFSLIFGIGAFAQSNSHTAKENSRTRKEEINLKLDFNHLKQVGEVSKRYQSYNIEMCEVVGGKFWIPYNILDTMKRRVGRGFDALKRRMPPVNLYNKKLRLLAAALGPVYVRVSGTWANTAYFQDNNKPKLSKVPAGYKNILTRKEWKGVIDFCKSVDAKLVTSFAISNGMRDKNGNWTPAQAGPLINYTKSIGGNIAAAAMFNEPSQAVYGGAPKNYNAAYFARDFAAFKKFVRSAMPKMKILGPGSTGEGGILPIDEKMSTDKIFAAKPKPDFDIFSYHFYGGPSKRCFGNLTPKSALSEKWLSKTDLGLCFYENARDKYQPGKPIWLTETAESACGGNKWAATYVDCFRYLEQLGRLAKRGVKVVIHNTLCASEYGLLDPKTYNPRPNYWAALLWSKLMGQKVFDGGLSKEGIGVYVHSLKNNKHGLAVLIVNPTAFGCSVSIPSEARQYLYTANNANKLQTKTVKLNGKILKLKSDGKLPNLKGNRIKGDVRMPAHSILFLSFKDK